MNALQIFNYNNEPVSFKKENDTVFINPVDMAKPFGKHPKDWFRTQYAKDFINALSDVRKCQASDLVQVTNGVGTWYQEDVAIEFARWISPSFAIWCNDRIKELMRHGLTTTEAMAEKLLNNPDFLIETLTALKSEREQKAILLEQTLLQQREIALVQPKAEYYDSVLQSTSVYVADQIAKEHGVSIVWKGSFAAAPTSPSNGWAYYNTTECQSYVYQGGTWNLLAKDAVIYTIEPDVTTVKRNLECQL